MSNATAKTSSNHDRLAALQEQVTAGVSALVESKDWAEMLSVAARFHHYSARNVLLILAQMPDATRVAGFKRWLELGRHVRKGEHGIAILAPCVYQRKPADESTTEAPKPGDAPAKTLHGFRVSYVFDESQTDGEPLPDVRPRLLTGEGPSGLWDALAKQVANAGFMLDRADCSPANGVTDHLSRTVSVRPDLDAKQACKTLAHELAHVLLEHAPRRVARPIAEVEAESVAFVVLGACGIDASEYTFPYVARWSDGDARTVKQTADRVMTTARNIIEPILSAPSDCAVAPGAEVVSCA